jgi:hypothetical protein
MNEDIEGAARFHPNNTIYRTFQRVLLCLVCWAACPASGLGAEEAGAVPAFPAKPASASGVLSVGAPVLDVPSDVGEKLGGAGLRQMLAAPFQNLLLESGRFRVLLDQAGHYGVKASITDLKIAGGKADKKISLNPIKIKIVRDHLNLGPGETEALEDFGDIDWGKSESKLVVSCTVSVQLVDTTVGGALLMAENGTVTQETTIREVSAKLGVLDLSKNGPPMELLAQYQTTLVEAALRDGLIKLLPKIDALLAQPPPAPAPVAAEVPPPVVAPVSPPAVPTVVPSPKFCSECGEKLVAGAKFCSGCGTAVQR